MDVYESMKRWGRYIEVIQEKGDVKSRYRVMWVSLRL